MENISPRPPKILLHTSEKKKTNTRCRRTFAFVKVPRAAIDSNIIIAHIFIYNKIKRTKNYIHVLVY